MTVSFSISLPDDVAADLDASASAQGLNRSQAVAAAIRRTVAYDLIRQQGAGWRDNRDVIESMAKAAGMPSEHGRGE